MKTSKDKPELLEKLKNGFDLDTIINIFEAMNPAFLLKIDNDKHRIVICYNGDNKVIKDQKVFLDAIFEYFDVSAKTEEVTKGISLTMAKENIGRQMIFDAIGYIMKENYTPKQTMVNYANMVVVKVSTEL